MAQDGQQPGPEEQVRQLFDQAEKQSAAAMEQLVHRDSFGEILARVTENAMGVTRIGFDVLDLAVRNLRIAGRPDLIRLGRQLARNEDKLERVLQEVERLRDEVKRIDTSSDGRSSGARPSTRRSGAGRARSGGGGSRSRSTSGRQSSG